MNIQDRTLLFNRLCDKFELDRPLIREAFDSDLCDVTSVNEVRFKEFDGDWRYHVAHVFAHWLCDLHGYVNHSKEEAERADKVADVIACLIHGYGRATTGEVLV